jgi:methylated-DNA-[protein]-cysteine S-methyltransferase
MKLQRIEVPSPIGRIDVVFHDDRVVGVDFADHRARLHALMRRRFEDGDMVRATRPTPVMRQVRDLFAAYFDGDLDALRRIPVDLRGTDFQRQVWRQLQRIRPGLTVSYAELARRIHRPRSVRAVGAANGSNPLSLIVPCHRAIGSNGALTGYAGGLDRKRWLLEHEGALG